jgi:hypothetical protein
MLLQVRVEPPFVPGKQEKGATRNPVQIPVFGESLGLPGIFFISYFLTVE